MIRIMQRISVNQTKWRILHDETGVNLLYVGLRFVTLIWVMGMR